MIRRPVVLALLGVLGVLALVAPLSGCTGSPGAPPPGPAPGAAPAPAWIADRTLRVRAKDPGAGQFVRHRSLDGFRSDHRPLVARIRWYERQGT